MATKDLSVSAGSSGGVSKDDWASLLPKTVGYEDALDKNRVAKDWEDMMKYAGLKSPNETTTKAFKLAVFVYAVLNGTSREGNYAADIVMSDGTRFNASVIPRATGRLNVRRFFRGDMETGYKYLKESRAIELEHRYVAKVAEDGISAEVAFATADFFQGCSLFTPLESNAYNKAFNRSVKRASIARGGSLENVEEMRVNDKLEAQRVDMGAQSVPMKGQSFF